jgi:lipopolysaccharide export system protein LptA
MNFVNTKFHKNFISVIIALITTLSTLHAEEALPSFGSAETSIVSDTLRMENTVDENHFFFSGNVKITSAELTATCDSMEVITKQSDEKKSDGLRKIGDISVIYANGNVTILQGDQQATAKNAIIYPAKVYIELIGDVSIVNKTGTVTGPRFIWEKGKPAYIPNEKGSRPTITLNASLPELTELSKVESDIKNKISKPDEKLNNETEKKDENPPPVEIKETESK